MTFENKTFDSLFDDGGLNISDMAFNQCCWNNCSFSLQTKSSVRRSVIKSVRITNCEIVNCCGGAGILEDVTVTGLKTNGLLQLFGAVYKRVTLKGKIDRVMLSSTVLRGASLLSNEEQSKFDAINDEFYRTVDWALDISGALFREFDTSRLRIPSSLIIRDKETQVVVRREKLLDGEWKEVDLSKTHFQVALEFLLERGVPDAVLVAPKRGKHFKELLAGLNRLRDAGIAEPD